MTFPVKTTLIVAECQLSQGDRHAPSGAGEVSGGETGSTSCIPASAARQNRPMRKGEKRTLPLRNLLFRQFREWVR